MAHIRDTGDVYVKQIPYRPVLYHRLITQPTLDSYASDTPYMTLNLWFTVYSDFHL